MAMADYRRLLYHHAEEKINVFICFVIFETGVGTLKGDLFYLVSDDEVSFNK